MSIFSEKFDLKTIPALRVHWAARAEELKPALVHKEKTVSRISKLEESKDGWLGWTVVPMADAPELSAMEWESGQSFVLDFGEHSVGQINLKLRIASGCCDSPVYIRLLAAELPFEMTYQDDKFTGYLSKAWIQEEYFKFDIISKTITLPRRYTLRYLLVEVIATPDKLIFDEVKLDTVSAVNYLPEPPAHLNEEEKAIYTTCCRTLRDCMQTCFEDGPKRDRRLWLGDLYLQAKANAVTYKDYNLVERSLYLLVSNLTDEGMIPACVFEDPTMKTCAFIPDYSMLFPSLLLDHFNNTGKREFLEEFYSLAINQLRIFKEKCMDENCLLNGKFWFFIDHQERLDRSTPEYCVYLYALLNLAKLADILALPEDKAAFMAEYDKWRAIIRKQVLNTNTGLLVSGEDRQSSLASQIWGILSGVLTPDEGREALEKTFNMPEAVLSRNPYLYHYLLEAYFICGQKDKAFQFMKDYWGKMLKYGADTCWEVFDLFNSSPRPLYYDNYLISFCHAWSCTPCVFLADN